MSTLYEVLGVAATASSEEIKAAYRRRVKETHPDTAGADREAFQRVQRAYDILGDPEGRATYDRDGEQPETGGLAPTPVGILVEAFRAVLDILEDYEESPLELTRIALRERRKVERKRLDEHALEAERWQGILDKIERREGAEAILESVLEQAIAPHTRGAAVARAWLDGIELALRLLEGYRWRDGAEDFFALADLLGKQAAQEERNGARPSRERPKTKRRAAA